jgi:hypothetical protein
MNLHLPAAFLGPRNGKIAKHRVASRCSARREIDRGCKESRSRRQERGGVETEQVEEHTKQTIINYGLITCIILLREFRPGSINWMHATLF